MRLKKLEIYGFKSFADRTEMSFDQGITGVVGPNGSGKSNLSDAVRWVLGEQSAKTLRGAKMEDVIFGGTEKRRKHNWCEVALTFDNADRALPVDFTEVQVSRRVYRNGDGEYYINKIPCRLKDVVDLFRDTGIGKEGYSLIGQGRIDEILSVKSEDRRQVFEEAAGIVKYKSRKLDAERRMENARLNLSRVSDIIAELEERLTPLREQSRAAREFITLREELKAIELNSFLQRSDRYAARVAELSAQMASLAESAEEAGARRNELSTSRDREAAALEAMERESASAREEVQSLIGRVEAREGAVAVGRERVSSLTRERERLSGEREDAERSEGELGRRLDDLAARIASERAEAARERDALAVDERELSKRAEALSAREREGEVLKTGIIDAMNRLSDVRSEQSRLSAMRDALDARLMALSGESDTERGALDGRRERMAAAEGELSAERKEHATLTAQVSRLATDLAAEAQLCDALGEKIRTLTASRGDAASRLRVLREMQRDYEGYQHSVKQVLLQARRTADSGVHGVVASLIQAPRELELALDMALGGALQNVVVEREEDAKRLIEFLRANRLGRATFLPLDSVTGRTLSAAERQALSLPGCLGVASELITYEPRYRGVVENLLGRTVVARDLAAGIAIQRAARHQFRLVTLDGDVMNPGGSMTGGSVQSRVTSLLSREREIAEHEALVKKLEGELEAAQRELSGREAQRSELKLQRTELYERIKQQEILCARAEAHVKAESDGLKEAGERLARLTSEADRLTEQRQGVEESLLALQNRQGDAEQVSGDRQAEVAELTARIAAERESLTVARRTVSDRQVKQAARERGLQAMESDQRRLTGERERVADLLTGGRDTLGACEGKLDEAKRALKDDEAALALEKGELDRARASFSDVDARRVAAQRSLQQMGARLDTLSTEIADLNDRQRRGEVQLTRVEGEFKQLTDRIWEDYELTYAGAEAFRQPDFKLGEADRRAAELRTSIRALGAVNVGAVDEYRAISERHEQTCAQRDDLIKAQMDLMGIIEELVRKMEIQFREKFADLNDNFGRTFNRLFGGGRAELQLTDPKDVLNCGIEVIAQPPGKKLQLLSLLSGGERALTAIAILFAMLKLKPTPFCFLDEIEAALDDANIANFAEYLRDYSRDTQFVVVTHRRGTMERCDALYGVAMEEKGVSKMVSIRLRDDAQSQTGS